VSWAVRGAAAVDAHGLRGTAPVDVRWGEDGLTPGRRLRWRRCFEAPFPTFRRLDPLSQVVCLAAEATGVAAILGDAAPEVAVVLGTAWGCLAADVEFAASLTPGRDVAPAVFPYTLPSTCLGEVALRHGLRGPTLCLSLDEDDPLAAAEVLAEALALEADGAAAGALVVWADAVPPNVAALRGLAPEVRATAALLGAGPAASGLPSLQALAAAADPARRLAESLLEAGA